MRVCSFESRRAEEMAVLIRKHGGESTVAPSMQEVTLDDNRAVFAFAERLLRGEVDVVIFLTGVGARALLDVAAESYSRSELLASLDRCLTIVRGPKPTVVLREWGVHIDHRAPEPNTWRELLAMIDEAAVELAGKTVALQEYGIPNPELESGLRARGAVLQTVPVYCWKLPDDTRPLEAAIRAACEGRFDVLLFTSAQQVRHVLEVAGRLGLQSDWMTAARACFIGSIGPTCSEAIRETGLPVHLEPSHPKMGVLVRETLESLSAPSSDEVHSLHAE
ncbi:MAG: uroporphyrinogen-III synthase [Planctomycetaceae bacterium]|nr:uroporphyrinogen-III synthase [Planctomycetaceae bacterium]